MSVIIPTCPTDCTGALPAIDTSVCGPGTMWGQVDYIYLAPGDTELTDWSDLSEWTTKLGDNTIVKFPVIGSKDAPEYQEVERSGQRYAYGPKKHKLMFRIDEVNTTNYEFMRYIECNPTLKMWYSAGGYLFGGDPGITASVKMDLIVPEDYNALATLTGEATWKAKHSPEMIDNPLD